ncbi:Aminomethyltransferase [Thiomonas sp. X19]|uniref:glycine cleavage system aminomethyltransferase GcvT n=1 Tax=Thiomonas sp. X19 TaxID=1050370 RepID=UPI000B63F16B|nr:glycine cleavage system aminomethyltransferase GcvT [Thiomonas sp. X19]SCC93206.1 Aminomethyltransferase [Thiomonas sp. X19]
MSVQTEPVLLQTPLFLLHQLLGAKMVPFAGYVMPVQYPGGIMAEHLHTRAAAGLFDVSHMGQVRISGSDAAAALESLIPIDVAGLPQGRQRYGYFTNDAGGIRDDLMLTHRPLESGQDSEYFLIVNAACKTQDLAWMRERIGARCRIEELPGQGLMALQGPKALAALQTLLPDVAKLRFMDAAWFELPASVCRHPVFISRSGYTGEDGVEISVRQRDAEPLARALLDLPDVRPVGLGARDSLRLEAGLCLYGHDMDETTTPVEASLQWAMQKVRRTGGARAGGFPGSEVILAQLDDPARVARKRVGLVAEERVPVREGTILVDAGGRELGRVTSGSLTPTANAPVAMGYVESAMAVPGNALFAQVRGKQVPMRVAPMPFTPHGYVRN